MTNLALGGRLAPDIVAASRLLRARRAIRCRTPGVEDEFNVRNDLNAFNSLLEADGLELYVMP